MRKASDEMSPARLCASAKPVGYRAVDEVERSSIVGVLGHDRLGFVEEFVALRRSSCGLLLLLFRGVFGPSRVRHGNLPLRLLY
jgi:hypothetical protein